MTYQLMLFDLDGTLVDSSPGIINSFKKALSSFGLSESDDVLKAMIGPPVPEIFKQLYPTIFSDADNIQRALHSQRVYYATVGVHESIVYPEVKKVLKDLLAQNKQLVVATSKPTIFAKKLLAYHGLSEHFSAIVGSHVNLTRSRKVEIIAYILKKYPQFRKESICMIGDRHHDLDAATALGISSIGVTYGYGAREEIIDAKPNFIIDHFHDLLGLLQ